MHREHKQHFFCYSQTIREWILDLINRNNGYRKQQIILCAVCVYALTFTHQQEIRRLMCNWLDCLIMTNQHLLIATRG